MGNSMSYHQRHYLYWGTILLLIILPDDGVHGWNIPYFGSSGPSSTSSINSAEDAVGVPIIDGGTPSSSLPLGSQSSGNTNNNIPLLSTVAAPLMGPVDAPHLRYIPSYFSNQIPTKIKKLIPTFLSTFHTAKLKIYHFLWYKPPVGIVGAWSLLRVMEKLYGIFSPPPPSSGEEALEDAEGRLRMSIKSLISYSGNGRLTPWGSIGKIYTANLQNQKMNKRRRKRKTKVRKGRSFDLDTGDKSYDNFGGIETVRVRACQKGLQTALAVTAKSVETTSALEDTIGRKERTSLFGVKHETESPLNNVDTVMEYTNDMEIALAALQLSCPPKGSREYFVEQSAEALSALSKYTSANRDIATHKKKGSKEPAVSIHEQNIQHLLHYSSKLIELRVLDALLRTLRDRHLLVAARLRRTRDYWRWHVNLSGGWLGRSVHAIRQQIMTVFPGLMGDDFRDRNQREYELATATWERELEMLGKAERLLLERPSEIEVGDLLEVMGESKQKQTSWWHNFANNGGSGDAKNDLISDSSQPSMAQTIRLLLQSKNRMWLKQTEQWTKQARKAIQFSLDETISTSFTPIEYSGRLGDQAQDEAEVASNLYAESQFLKKWATYDDSASDAYSWVNVLTLVDYAATPKRAGERRHFQISGITARIKRYDFLGIPSSALLLAGANSLHDNVIEPHKQEIVGFFYSLFTAIWGIIEFRFVTPMKDIMLDLLNRRPRMVDPFALLNEQTSLDNMLLDLGVGDGTAASRSVALAAASRMYEQEVAGGALRGLFRGRVAQLMLIQIQQLKADLLQAMDQIDNLVDANRLNVQLVASVPAVLILIFGTRALFLAWSNIRMKDFRLPHDVHAEMSDYLKKVEECLILSNYELDTVSSNATKNGPEVPIPRADACLRPKDLGKLLLLLHSYLNLLDYMTPPFPSKTCDSIHQSVQNMLMQGQMSTSRQLELLKVIQSKHADLLKSL